MAATGLAAAQPATVWIGPDDGTWFNAAHWAGGVPAQGSRAYIDGGRVQTPRGSPTAYAGTLVVGATAATRLSSLGDRWQLLSFEAASGTFDRPELPALEAGLRWDARGLYTQGTLQVAAVPEPASALLFALGGLGLWWRGRAAFSRRQRRPAAAA